MVYIYRPSTKCLQFQIHRYRTSPWTQNKSRYRTDPQTQNKSIDTEPNLQQDQRYGHLQSSLRVPPKGLQPSTKGESHQVHDHSSISMDRRPRDLDPSQITQSPNWHWHPSGITEAQENFTKFMIHIWEPIQKASHSGYTTGQAIVGWCAPLLAALIDPESQPPCAEFCMYDVAFNYH